MSGVQRVDNENRLLAFDYGVSTVRVARETHRIPDEGVAPAVDTQITAHLDALFDTPTIADCLATLALPEISDRGVLEPTAYVQALDEARASMLSLAASSTGEHRAVFAAALEVLEDTGQSRAVLDAARLALLRA
jgi:uncharacterized protein (DUF2235 family)